MKPASSADSGRPTAALVAPVELSRLDGHDVLLQSGFWGSFKSSFGWKPQGFLIDGLRPLLVLTRRIGGRFSLCYVPHGPQAETENERSEDYLSTLAHQIRSRVPPGCIFLRFDVPWGSDGQPFQPHSPFWRAPMDVQPPNTVIVDLAGEEAQWLERMKPKTRYNIRLAEKRGVVVSRGTVEDLPAWYELYRVTSARDRIAIHGFPYYRRLFELADAQGPQSVGSRQESGRTDPLVRAPMVDLLLARLPTANDALLAGIILVRYGRRATYLFGASSDEHRNLMATYLLQWEAMRLSKEGGCERYDLFGIPYRDDPNDPMYGLYRFKTGFGGAIVHYPGSWDYPFRPLLYRAYRLAERARAWYFKRFRKRGRLAGD